MPLTITKDNYKTEVEASDKPVILDFWAEWCGPCRMLAPVIEEISAERTDLKVGKINVDEQGTLADAFKVSSIPTVVLIRNGEPAAISVGYRDKAALLRALGL